MLFDKMLEFLRTMVEFFFIISGGDKVVALTIVGLVMTTFVVVIYGATQVPSFFRQVVLYSRERSEGERVSFARSEHGKPKKLRRTTTSVKLPKEETS